MKRCIYFSYLKTSIGELVIGALDDRLCLLDFRYRKLRQAVDRRLMRWARVPFVMGENAAMSDAKAQVLSYLAGERQRFDIDILLLGTPFQKRVWQALGSVPYGQTASYLDVARRIGQPSAVRAVAQANGANAIALVVPCHRIIRSNGELGGYGGGLRVKKRLLLLESRGQGKLF